MAALPSGTVTLLFSDMEGSTKLLVRLGDEYADALDVQRAQLRAAWSGHGGIELGTEGDSFYVVFENAAAAVAAAVQGQRAMLAAEFPRGEQVRVRIGVHTGGPRVHGDAYVGIDVHRAARIAAAAHGGQILISGETAALVREAAAAEVSLRDLGSHSFKDLASPERVFQVIAEGLIESFPAVRSLGAVSGLPSDMTPLVGRNGELREVLALVTSGRARLVTLTGPGGSGKTRLATALADSAAQDFPDGVYFVPLASVSSGGVMWTTIADVLGLPPAGKVPPAFFEHVAERRMLLVLDNLEQIAGADEVVAALLANAPEVVALATSRSPLHLRGEHEYQVPPLSLATGDDATVSAAVQMFVQQARMVRPSFKLSDENAAAVGEICARLDGLPLAIELAASKAKVLSPAALLARLDQGLDIAARGVDRPARQQTLRDTITWSYELLTLSQQQFLDRLGVFAGGADLDAAAAVTDGIAGEDDLLDLVTELADTSMLNVTESADGEPRVVLLETIRAFACERLERFDQLGATQKAHASYYGGLASAERERLDREDRISGSQRHEQRLRSWFELNLDNLRAALRWSLPSPPGDFDDERIGLGLVLYPFVSVGILQDGYLMENDDLASRATHWANTCPGSDAARCFIAASEASRAVGDWELCLSRATRADLMAQEAGDARVSVMARAHIAWALANLDSDDALPTARSALATARELESRVAVMMSLVTCAVLERVGGRPREAMNLEQEALELAIAAEDYSSTMVMRQNLACSQRALGRSAEAYEQLVAFAPDVLEVSLVDTLVTYGEDLACVLGDLGRVAAAAKLIGSVESLRAESHCVRQPSQREELRDPIERVRIALGRDWDRHYNAGAQESVEDVIREVMAG